MKRSPARIALMLALFAAAASACEPSDFMAPSEEDASSAVLSALQALGGMPGTVRFENFNPGLEIQLIRAVRAFDWGSSEAGFNTGYRDVQLSLKSQDDSGYLFGYQYLWEGFSPIRDSDAEVLTAGGTGLITTDRVRGAWESGSFMVSVACGRGRAMNAAERARLLQAWGFSPNAVVLQSREW